MPSNWTHACCNRCWWRVHAPVADALGKRPEPIRLGCEPETCGWCGERTTSGIYVREDPLLVPFPGGASVSQP